MVKASTKGLKSFTVPVIPSEAKSLSTEAGLESNPVTRAMVVAECDKQGLTLGHLVGTIKRATEAKKTIVNKFGDVSYEEDYATQLRGAIAGLEVRGELKAKDSSDGVTNNFIDVKALVQMFNNSSSAVGQAGSVGPSSTGVK